MCPALSEGDRGLNGRGLRTADGRVGEDRRIRMMKGPAGRFQVRKAGVMQARVVVGSRRASLRVVGAEGVMRRARAAS